MTNKQYKLPASHEETAEAIHDLEKLGIIRLMQRTSKSTVWLMKSLDRIWWIIVDYCKLNKIVPLHAWYH